MSSEGMKGIRIAPVSVGDVAEAPEQPRAGARRGELMRRRLIIADAVGLALAFLVAELLFGRTVPADRLSLTSEYLLFVLTLPGWVAVAKLYRLYDNDDERTDHSTIDDFVGVFHLATVGAWLVFVAAWASGAASPGMTKLVTFWALAVVLVTGGRAIARATVRRQRAYLQNSDHRRCRRRRPADRPQAHAAPGVRHQASSASSTATRRSDARTSADLTVLGATGRAAASLIRELDVERVIIAFSNDPHGHESRARPPTARSSTSRSTSSRGCSRSSARTSRCTRSRGWRSSGCRPRSGSPPRASSSAGSTSSLASVAARSRLAALRVHRVANPPRLARPGVLPAGPARAAPCASSRCSSSARCSVDTDDVAHREYIEQTMSRFGDPDGERALQARARGRSDARSDAGCGGRASTSCRS